MIARDVVAVEGKDREEEADWGELDEGARVK
jgi:hypothetical protein